MKLQYNDELLNQFEEHRRKKKAIYVKLNDVITCSSDSVLTIELGSCVGIILCGINDSTGEVWLGANHLFKYRKDNNDIALEHVSKLYHDIQDMGASRINCLGLFGAGYREKSLAKNIATKNTLTILEALSIYNLTVELFQTGYSQGVSALYSDELQSFLLKHYDMDRKETKIIEFPREQIFPLQ